MTRPVFDLLCIVCGVAGVVIGIWLFSAVLDYVDSCFAEIPAPEREPVEHFEGEPR